MSETNAALVLNGQYDTPAIRDGSIQYVKCENCGAEAGEPCFLAISREPLMGFAHVVRRMEYYEWRDIFGPATQTWEWTAQKHDAKERARKRFHERVERLPPCSHPRPHCARCSQCECGALLSDHREALIPGARVAPDPLEVVKSNTDVDDLLG